MIRKVFLHSLKNNLFKYIVLLILVILLVLIGLVPARALEHIINDYLIITDRKTKIIISLAFIYCFALVFSGILDFIKQILLINLGESFTKDIRLAMANKLKTIDSQYLSNNDNAVITSRFINDVDAINTVFTDGIISMGIDALKIIGVVISMFFYDYRLGLFTLLIIPLIYFVSSLFKKLMFRAQMKNRVIVGDVNNHISETISNTKMIKIYSKEGYMENEYKKDLEGSYRSMMKVSFYDSFYSPLIQFTCAAIICIFIIIFDADSLSLGLSVGVIAGSIEYISSIFSPIESLGMELQTIQKAKSGITRVNEFLKAKDESSKKVDSINQLSLDNQLSIEFKNVSFRYEDGDLVIKDLSLKINRFEKISFIGRTGVGKTTLFKLILGNLSPASGKITINGINVCDIKNELKYRIFGYVDQQFDSIDGSVKENLTMKNENITNDDVINALKIVGIDKKILSLKDSIDTRYDDNMFSQGEKQLLNIARAIVSNPPILLLDEMTASLDTITEQRILEALDNASKNRTILSISHRLSSCLNASKIIQIENGSISHIYSLKEFESSDLFKSLKNKT